MERKTMTDKKAAGMTKQECIEVAMSCIDAARRSTTNQSTAFGIAFATKSVAYLLLAQVKSE